MRGLGALVSCRQATSSFDLGHGQRFHVETLTFLCGRQASQSNWRKSSLSHPTGCRAEFGIESRLFQ